MTGPPEQVDVVSNPHAAAVRRRRLERYTNRRVLANDVFVCRHQEACKESALRRPGVAYHEGQLSYVGPHYELRCAERELRVLIVPMENGGPPGHVNLDVRSRQVRRLIREPFRSRNPHMRGVTLALQLAFGLPLGTSDGEWLSSNIGPIHILDGYAMANLLLCSAVLAGTTTSKATATMRANCIEHLVKTIEILEPTLIISQGKTVEPTLRAAFESDEQIDERVWKARCAGSEFVWVALHHPTRNWESPGRPYLRDVVAPALTRARATVLGTDGVGGRAADAPERAQASPGPGGRSSQARTAAPATPPTTSPGPDSGTVPNRVVARRLAFIPDPEQRRQAAARFAAGEPVARLAAEYGLTRAHADYCLRQELVSSGKEHSIDPTDLEAVRACLANEGWASVQCRTGLPKSRLRILLDA